MARYDASTGECLVFAFREGLLSRAAHDLEIRVEQFEIRVDDTSHQIEATFRTNSLRLISAKLDGQPEELSERDIEKIHNHIAEDVLHAQQFPEVSFSSSEVEEVDGGFRVQGSLNLHGQVGTIGADIRSDGGRWTTEVSIDQRDYGIRPFRALFGLIRIKPVVRVRVSVPQVARE